ncbi:hypothetical protein J3E69DRAFT_379388 [Trichoderma sp. SZMC 28015]
MEDPRYLVSNLSDADRGGHTVEAERLTTLDTDQDLKTLRASHSNSLDLFVDLLLLSCSIAFIVFAGILGHLNGQPVGSIRGWNNIQNLYNKLSTVFPILFGSIVAKAIRKTATWRLEKGTTLGTVELLMGSLDIGRSISAIYNLRLLNIAGLGLLVIWSLSPLGSQALLYIIRVEQTPIFSAFTVPYMDTVMLSSPFDPENSNFYGSAFETNTSDFTFSMDSWGNVKIPDYASAVTANGANSSGWINFQPTDDIPYSSLIGLPVILPSSAAAGNTTFALESSYFSLSCENLSVVADTNEFINCTAIESQNVFSNDTFYGLSNRSTWSLCLDGFYDPRIWDVRGHVSAFGNDSNFVYPARTLLFQSSQPSIDYAIGLCSITTEYIESAVFCVGAPSNNCSVTAVRLSTQPHPAPNFTDLSFSQAFSEFSLSITESDITSPSPPENGVSLSELFITNPITVGLPGPAGAAWDGLTASLFGLRIIDKLAFYPPANRLNTTATNVVWQDTYVVHWQWLTLLVIGSLLMFAAALISLYLSWETHAPEVLGYVSTLIINSPYVRDCREVGSTMSGEDRARKFAKLPLKICDVQPHADIGYIAIAQDDGSTERRGLDLDRLYR